MATYYWVAPGVRIWNDTTDAWSLSDGGAPVAAYPTTGDTAIFKASSGSENCTITANVSIASLSMYNDFAGELRTDNLSTYVHTITGDCIFGCAAAGSIKLGTTSTWSIGGNLQCNLVLGTWLPGSSKIIMTGTGKGLQTGQSGATYFYDLEINGTVTANTTTVRWHHDLTVKTNKTLTVPTTMVAWNIGAVRQSKIYLESGATLDVSTSYVAWYSPGVGGVASMAATANLIGGTVYNFYPSISLGVGVWAMSTTNGYDAAFQVWGPATTDGQFTFPNQYCHISGTVICKQSNANASGSLNIRAGGSSCNVDIGGHLQIIMEASTTANMTVTQSTGNYWRIGASFVTSYIRGSGGFYWNSGTEIIYFTGAEAGRYLDARNIADPVFNIIRVQKTGSGSILQYGDLYCNGLDIIDGIFDLNEYDAYIDNLFRVQSGAGWTQSSASVINLQSTTNTTNCMAYATVDPVVLNKTANGVTLSGHFYCRTLTLTNGTWNANGYDVTVTGGGVVKGPDTLTTGSGTWTLGGTTNIAGASSTGSTRFVMTASSTFTYTSEVDIGALTVNTGVTVTLAGGPTLDITSGLDLYGTLSFNGHTIRCIGPVNVHVRSTGVLTSSSGDGIWLYETTSGYGVISNAGTWAAYHTVFMQCQSGSLWAPGTYGGSHVQIRSEGTTGCYVKPDGGTFNITILDLYQDSTGILHVDMTNNPTFNIAGSATYSGGVDSSQIDWTVGSETLEFVGTANQTYEWAHGIGNVVLDNSGSGTGVVCTSSPVAHLDCKSLTGTDGGLWTNGIDVDVAGDVILDMDEVDTKAGLGVGGTWTIAGNFDYKDVITWDLNSLTLFDMTGTNKYLLGAISQILTNLTVSGSTYVHSSTDTSIDVQYETLVTGTLTVDTLAFRCNSGDGNMTINNGTVTGTGTLRFLSMGVGKGLTLVGAYTFSIASTVFYDPQVGVLIPPGNYTNGEVKIWAQSENSTWQPLTGAYNFHSLRFSSENDPANYSLLVDNTTNIPAFTLTGEFNVAPTTGGIITVSNNGASAINWNFNCTDGNNVNFLHHSIVWNKGSGTLTFAGSGSHTLDTYTNDIEDVVFNGSGTWTLDTDATIIKPESFTLSSGTFDADTSDVTITGTGNLTLTDGIVYMGEGTWTCNGNVDISLATPSNFHQDSGKLVMTGTGKTIKGNTIGYGPYHFEVSTGATITNISAALVVKDGTCVINGTFDIAAGFWIYGNCQMTTGPSSSITGTFIVFYYSRVGGGLVSYTSGSISVGDIYLRNWSTTAAVWPAGVYSSNLHIEAPYVGHCYITFGAGSHTYTGYLHCYSGSVDTGHQIYIYNNTYNPDITIGSYFRSSATNGANVVNWFKGTGLITFTGATYIDTSRVVGTLDAIEIDSSGTMDLNSDIDCQSLLIDGGIFDADDWNVTINDFFRMNSGTTCRAGTDTWDVGGDWDTVAATASGSFLAESGEIQLTGSGNIETYCSGDINAFYRLTISGTYTHPESSDILFINTGVVGGWLKVTNGGTFTTTDTGHYIKISGSNDIIVESGGEIVIATGGRIYCYQPASGYGIPTNDGQITGTGTLFLRYLDTVNPFDDGIYPNTYYHSNSTRTLEFAAGTYTFGGYLIVNADSTGDVTIDMGTNNPTVNVTGIVRMSGSSSGTAAITRAGADTNWNISGDFQLLGAGPKVYTKGAAGSSITLDGTGTQELNFSAGDVEDVIVDKASGTAILTGNMVTDSFLGTAGEIDFNGQTLQTIGDFTINSANSTGFSVVSDADAMNAADIIVGNDFYVSNVTFNATNTWTLDVQGASALAFDVSVRYSNANAGTTIDATAPGNTDLGVNYNWDFGALPGEAVSSIHSLSIHCFPWTRMTNRHVRGFRRR